MKLHVLGSNSFGNGYVLENDTEALIIETGVRLLQAKKALKFKISKVVGAIVTHEHNDHAGFYHEYLKAGFPVLANEFVYQRKGTALMPSWAKVIVAGNGYRAGGFKVIPFNVKHDVPCLGYLIDHAEMGRLLFITDTMMCEYTFPGLNHIMLEANYADDILLENIENGRMPCSMRPRLLESHMELDTTKEILRSNDLSAVSNIILIHLSDGNSHEERFIREVREVTGKTVYAANKGMTIDLSKNPY